MTDLPETQPGCIVEVYAAPGMPCYPAIIIRHHGDGVADLLLFHEGGVQSQLSVPLGQDGPVTGELAWRWYPHQLTRGRIMAGVMDKITKLVEHGHLQGVPCEPQQGMTHPQAGSNESITLTIHEVQAWGLSHALTRCFNSLPQEGGTVNVPDQALEFRGELPPVPSGIVLKGGPNTRLVPT